MSLLGSGTSEITPNDSTVLPSNCGFIADLTGSFEGKLRDDAAVSTFNVIGGAYYAGDLALIQDTGLVNVVKVQIWFCKVTG